MKKSEIAVGAEYAYRLPRSKVVRHAKVLSFERVQVMTRGYPRGYRTETQVKVERMFTDEERAKILNVDSLRPVFIGTRQIEMLWSDYLVKVEKAEAVREARKEHLIRRGEASARLEEAFKAAGFDIEVFNLSAYFDEDHVEEFIAMLERFASLRKEFG